MMKKDLRLKPYFPIFFSLIDLKGPFLDFFYFFKLSFYSNICIIQDGSKVTQVRDTEVWKEIWKQWQKKSERA